MPARAGALRQRVGDDLGRVAGLVSLLPDRSGMLGSPWENPFAESFNSRVRDELLAVVVFSCRAEVKVMVEDFRRDYNSSRPHRAHGMMTPTAFAAGWRTAHETARASAELHSPCGLAPQNAGASPTLDLPTSHRLSQQVDP